MNLNEFNLQYSRPNNRCCAGRKEAQCLILSDYPGYDETNKRLPIAGYTWVMLKHFLDKSDISTAQIRIETFWPFTLKGAGFPRLDPRSFKVAAEALHQRIEEMPNLNVIVAMNNETLFVLTGKGKVSAAFRNQLTLDNVSVSEAEKKADISSLRGSIYTYRAKTGRTVKIIPVNHPRVVSKYPKWAKRSFYDWRKIQHEMEFNTYHEIRRHHVIEPSEYEVEQFTKNIELGGCEALSTDIETWGNKLSCVGYAPNEYYSITIPTVTKQQEATFLPYIKRLNAVPAGKIFCNGLYDTYWLHWPKYNVQVENYMWDVQYMHHCLDPLEKHSLDFLASIYSNQNYWKDEAKDADEILKYSKKLDSLWTYNGLDCCVTYEVWKNLIKELQDNHCLNTYFELYLPLLSVSLCMSLNGMRVDRKKQNDGRKELERKLLDLRNKLEDIAGENLFATESKTFYREPTDDEWDILLPPSTSEKDFNDKGIPHGKIINREGRDKLKKQGINYYISGNKAGQVSYKKDIDKKDFAKVKLFKLFHETLGLPKQFKRRKGAGKRTQSLDEGTIRKLINKYPDKAAEAGNLLLTYRELQREHIYLRGGYDGDGRIRASFRPVTDAGRFRSAKNPRGTGYNLQNLKR